MEATDELMWTKLLFVLFLAVAAYEAANGSMLA